MAVLKGLITCGSIVLIVLGCLHAIYVAQADDVEPYLWIASVFLIAQGVVTLVYLKQRKRRRRSYPT